MPLLLAALLVVVTFAAFSPALQGGFLWDDDEAVADNTLLRSADGLRSIWTDPEQIPQRHYWPLVYTTFWIEYQVWGLATTGYHLVNVLLHVVNTFLLLAILRRLHIPGALFATALFALHPLHTESVAWIVERKDVLSATFYLAACLAWLRFMETRSRAAWGLALVAFLAAMLSKSISVTLPLTFMIVIWWRSGRLTRRDVLPLLPFVILGAGLAVFDVALSRSMVRTSDLTLVERFFLAPRIAWFYLWKILAPLNLTAIYPLWTPRINAVGVGALAAGIAALWAGLVLAARGRRGPLAALLFFLVTLAPLLGFVDFEYMVHSFVADRYIYLAGIGPLVFFAVGADRLRHRLRLGPVPTWSALVLVCTVLAGLTAMNATRFRSMRALFQDVVEANPGSYVAHQNLGSELMEAGELGAAEHHLRDAVRLAPESALAQHGLGTVLLMRENPTEAAQAFGNAVALRPDFGDAHANLGVALLQCNRSPEAVAALEDALRLLPMDGEVRANLLQALYAAYLVELGHGARENALLALRRILELEPRQPRVLVMAAWLLAVPQEGQPARPAQALALAGRAAEVVGERRADILEVLAAALAADERHEEAVRAVQAALDLADPQQDAAMIRRLRAAKTRYAAGEPPLDDRFQ